jgi:beta-glucosidase
VRSGQISSAKLDESVRRVLRVKFALGLFDHPYVDEAAEQAAMLRPDSVALAEKAAEESLVLLKNSPEGNRQPILPLSNSVQKIALIGPLADDPSSMLGSWAGLGQPEDTASLRSALLKKIGEENLIYARGTGITSGTDEESAEAAEAAARGDVVILALGEDAGTMTGEASSKTKLGLPGRQQELLEKIAATGKPVVLILFSGRPLTLPWAFEHVPAVMAAWFPGIQAGPALVRTLYGEANPSGRLVVSWPRSVGQEPLYYNALSTGRPAAKEDSPNPQSEPDDKYLSRYLDEQNSPQFPFGFGLSYTTFRYGKTELSATQLKASALGPLLMGTGTKHSTTVLTASADVTNSGSSSGDEVIQLYVRLRGTSVAQPVRALKGFKRVSLAAGETKRVTFELGPDAFALWDDHNRWAVEPSDVTIWISPNSLAGSKATLQIIPR